MQIIAAPSKTQTTTAGTGSRLFSQPQYAAKATLLIKAMRQLTPEQLSGLMKTSEKLTQSTLRSIQAFSMPFTLQNARQAIFTFKGDAYSALTPDNYTDEELEHAQKHLFILSGLYGILRPLDLIQPYRLEMAHSLQCDEALNLYQFWQKDITGTINRALDEDDDRTLINLASKEYAKAVKVKELRGRMVNVTFRQYHKGEYKILPFHAKKARGEMIHFIITEGLQRPQQLRHFTASGYSLSDKDTTEQEMVFLKR